MIWKIFITILIAVISGIGYRMGGSGRYPRWTRLSICAGGMALSSLVWGLFTPWILLSIGLLIGALSTYWKKKGTDAKWYNWMFTGMGYALSMLPLAIYYQLWIPFLLFFIVMTGAITVWSVLINKDVVEEIGRGVILILSMLILFIGKKIKEKK